MTETILRRFRGIGIALVVLALSAGVAFAAAPSLHPVSSPGAEEATETPEPTETPEATEVPEPTETPEATEAPEAPDGTEAPDAGDTGDHGALVSAAAQMDTPDGFANHGAFVSCVAHMKDATLATIDWTTVTPEACAAAAPGGKPDAQDGKVHGNGNGNGKGAEQRAAHAPGG
jgi:hypothetical protein